MNVEQLLGDKGREVISVQPHRTLGEAVRTLSERRIGAVVVMGADGAWSASSRSATSSARWARAARRPSTARSRAR